MKHMLFYSKSKNRHILQQHNFVTGVLFLQEHIFIGTIFTTTILLHAHIVTGGHVTMCA